MQRPILRKLRTLARAGGRQKLLFAEAVVQLAGARIRLAILPFHKIAPGLGVFVPASDPRALAMSLETSEGAAVIARQIGWAVCSVAPWMPFKAVCLQQALAAHAMLRRRGIKSIMHLGSGRDEARALAPHAWLDAAGVGVTGYPMASDIRQIGCFV